LIQRAPSAATAGLALATLALRPARVSTTGVKLKVAGCFRTPWRVQAFCITRSSLSTLKKQGRELLPSLEATFNGDDPLMGLDI
jgi:hypothetical protein